MKEYIEREAVLIELGRNSIIDKITYADEKTIREKIADFPAADVVERVRGEWVYVNGFAVCSRCGASPAYHEPKPKNEQGFPPFCFECGADMRGKENAENEKN